MSFDPRLEIGQIVTNDEIVRIFKVDNSQGIRTSRKHKYIVITLTHDNSPYNDRWHDDGYHLDYMGGGKEEKGDQKLEGRNKTLRDAYNTDKELFFFEQVIDNNKKKYIYRGLCDLVGEPWQAKEKCKNGSTRLVYMFPIKLRNKRIDFNHSDKEIEVFEDEDLDFNKKLANISRKDISKKAREYIAKPQEKAKPVEKQGIKIYPRNKEIALNALKLASFQCEADFNHESFIRKNTDAKYMEPHHLIPMSFSDQFEYSLDVEANIVSLCSDCHNLIHYGEDRYTLLKKLYNMRKDSLKDAGIEVSFEELKRMYK